MRLAALLLLAIGVAAGIWDSLSREAGEKSAVAAESRAVVETYLQAGVLTQYAESGDCLLYTSPSPRDLSTSRMPSSA